MTPNDEPQEQGAPLPPSEMYSDKRFTKADAKLIAFGTIAVLAGIFIGQNTIKVQVHLIFGKANIRLIWVFLLCIAVGIALDRLLTWRGVLPAARKRRPRGSQDPTNKT
ncbi:MAG: LapA family protein [Actinomycetota bacterium]